MANVIIVKWSILSTYLLTYLLTCLFTYLLQPTYYNLPTHPPTSLPTYLPIGHPPIGLPTHLPPYLLTYLSTHPSTTTYYTFLPTSYNIPNYVPNSLVMMCWNKHVKLKTWQMLNTFWWCGPLVKDLVYIGEDKSSIPNTCNICIRLGGLK
jgi:hypothetical protein